jgi:hypothetical protein
MTTLNGPIDRTRSQPGDLAAQHADLMAQHQDFDIFARVAASTEHQQLEQSACQ